MKKTQAHQYAALILRVSLGIVFIAHGLLKVLVFTLPGTAQFFEGAGFPGWLAYPVAYLEIGGGGLLIAGIATRQLSLLFLPILLGALWVHAGNGWVFSNSNGGWVGMVHYISTLCWFQMYQRHTVLHPGHPAGSTPYLWFSEVTTVIKTNIPVLFLRSISQLSQGISSLFKPDIYRSMSSTPIFPRTI